MNIIGQTLFEAAAQTFTGALASYTFDKIKNGIYKNNSFNGAFDLWQRGIHCKSIDFGDSIGFDGLISPYIQLFPRDPYQNAKRWSTLFEFNGKIDSNEFSTLEFYAGSDETIRTGSLNGETLVGLYNRYGYIGEGVLGVISTSYLLKQIPEFFQKDYWGSHVKLTATLSKCPSQHGFVAQGMFQKVGITLNTDTYKEIPYLKINSIKLYNNSRDKISSLLGSPWAATAKKVTPYLVQYGYISNREEWETCNNKIYKSPYWNDVRVFYDAISCPTSNLSYTNIFMK